MVADELVFGDAKKYRNDLLAQPQDNDYNKCLCSTAYRQYILWKNVHIGAETMVVIHCCFVWRIKDNYSGIAGQ